LFEGISPRSGTALNLLRNVRAMTHITSGGDMHPDSNHTGNGLPKAE
jgi:hypothetical protein